MFTTIQALRDSSAMQERVTTVENYLKKTYGNGQWNPSIPFPAAIVLISNTRADFEWVMDNKKELVFDGVFNGVDSDAFAHQDDFASKAEAQGYIDSCISLAQTISAPLMQNPSEDDSENKDVPFPKSEAPARTAKTLARPAPKKAPAVKAPRQLASEQCTLPMIKNFAAKVRVRKDMETLLTALGASKLVTMVAPLNNAVAKSAHGAVIPKGKQAYIVVF